MRKNAIELSVNFLVLFVLAIVLFGGSVYLINNLYSQAKDAIPKSQEDLNKKIEDLSCSSTETICVINNHAKVSRDQKIVQMGIKVYNVANDKTEYTITEFEPANYPDGPTPIFFTDPVVVEAKSEGKIGFAFSVKGETEPQEYTFFLKLDIIEDTNTRTHTEFITLRVS
jgi:hypothetical protein